MSRKLVAVNGMRGCHVASSAFNYYPVNYYWKEVQ